MGKTQPREMYDKKSYQTIYVALCGNVKEGNIEKNIIKYSNIKTFMCFGWSILNSKCTI